MSAVHVISHANRHLYERELDDHFRLRHKIFIEERGWRELERSDGRDIDAYDDEYSEYLLAIEGERVVGGLRFRQTCRSSMIADIFPQLVEQELPCSRHVLELSRYFVVRERRSGRTDWRLMAAAQAYCVEAGVTAVIAVAETSWIPRWQHAGFRPRPLGRPMLIADAPTVALLAEIRAETSHYLQRKARLMGAPLVRRGLPRCCGAVNEI